MASRRVPTWIIRDEEIVRVRDARGFPTPPRVEGRITRAAPDASTDSPLPTSAVPNAGTDEEP